MEDPQDGPRGEIIEKTMVLQHFFSEVSVSLETSSKKCLRMGLQTRLIMNDDADDDDDDDGGGGGGDDDDDDDDGNDGGWGLDFPSFHRPARAFVMCSW